MPLTQNTRIGDSSTGYGFDHGKFAFTSTFTKDSNSVTIFPTEPKVYVETLDFTITSSTPPSNIPLCIRFYDSKTKDADAKYNAVTGPKWKWPSFPNGSSIPRTCISKSRMQLLQSVLSGSMVAPLKTRSIHLLQANLSLSA